MASTGENAKTANVNGYNVDNYEYFENVEPIIPFPTEIKAYIPKYMPNVTKGLWKKPYPISINSLQANASDCKVSLPTTVMEQGYITIGHYPNERPNFTDKATLVNGKLTIKKGNQFIAEVLYSDASEIKFIGKV